MSHLPHQVVLSTCPDMPTAQRIATELVSRRLAACVNLVPDVTSVYRWEDQIHTDAEILMVIKTDKSRYPALEAAVRELHPYELPEIVAVTLDNGSAGYLRWITSTLEETTP
ncbi:MAG TPA: divalent-cation tolerance protein CutA [Chromatiales bacterium]|nr:divalent-cation tolerance protein CutA [Chromatiales bacterium]